MKKYLLLALLLVATGGLMAQERISGDITPLLKAKSVRVEFDFSKAMFNGLTMQQFVDRDYVDDYGKADWKRSIMDPACDTKMRFITKYNKVTKGAAVPYAVAENHAGAVMLFKFGHIKRNGTFDAIVEVMMNGKQIATYKMEAKGGKFGSFTNLLGDACERAGGKMGKLLRDKSRGKAPKMEIEIQ